MDRHLPLQNRSLRTIFTTGLAMALMSACGAPDSKPEVHAQQIIETLIVIEARNSALEPGAAIQSDLAVTIPQNGFIRVVTPAGRVTKIAGPVDGPIGTLTVQSGRRGTANEEGSERWRQVYSALLEKSEATSLAVRAGKQGDDTIDISNDNNICVSGTPNLKLVAAAPGYNTSLKISTRGETVELPWTAGQTSDELPGRFLKTGKNELVFSFMDGAVTSVASVYMFETNDLETAINMLEIDGCENAALKILGERP